MDRIQRVRRLDNLLHRNQDRIYPARHIPATERLSRFDFIQLYRLTPETFDELIVYLDNDLRRPTTRSHSLSVSDQVEIALRFYACGTFQSVVGDSMKVKQPTVSRIVRRVTDALLNHARDLISWPTLEQQHVQAAKFAQQRRMPNVLGCVDGTHVRLVNRPHIHEEAYINRKQYHSINAMVTCDADLRIIHLDTRWPGSTNDARVFNMSSLMDGIENNRLDTIPGSYLLGDSAYALKTYCMVQYQDRPTLRPHQRRFNAALRSTRSTVERCIGVMKKRWTCLNGLRNEPEKASRIIAACACLHNFCLGDPIPIVENYASDSSDDDDDGMEEVRENALLRRNEVALTFA